MEKKEENIIAKWFQGSISDAELNSKFDADMAEDLKIIQDATSDLIIPDIDSQALLHKIKVNTSPTAAKAKVSSLKYWISAIAAIVIGVLAYTSVINQKVSIDNRTLSHSMHNLPDGSTVHLNANSQIEYDKAFLQNRNITLYGEAFFEVEKGQTFTVHTNNGDVSVLGTSFNVFAREDNFSVACKTGKVKVSTTTDNILNPGDKVIYIKGGLLEQSKVKFEQIDSWRNGESIFKSSPLSEVVLALTAQYNYSLKGSNIDLSQRFTGSFVHNDIEKAVRMVFLPMGISYNVDRQNRNIIIE